MTTPPRVWSASVYGTAVAPAPAPVQGHVLVAQDAHAHVQALQPIEPAHARAIDRPPHPRSLGVDFVREPCYVLSPCRAT